MLLPVEPETLADCLLDAAILAVAGSVDEETTTEVACSSPKNQEVATGYTFREDSERYCLVLSLR